MVVVDDALSEPNVSTPSCEVKRRVALSDANPHMADSHVRRVRLTGARGSSCAHAGRIRAFCEALYCHYEVAVGGVRRRLYLF